MAFESLKTRCQSSVIVAWRRAEAAESLLSMLATSGSEPRSVTTAFSHGESERITGGFGEIVASHHVTSDIMLDCDKGFSDELLCVPATMTFRSLLPAPSPPPSSLLPPLPRLPRRPSWLLM